MHVRRLSGPPSDALDAVFAIHIHEQLFMLNGGPGGMLLQSEYHSSATLLTHLASSLQFFDSFNDEQT
jgi:hypothetical protein